MPVILIGSAQRSGTTLVQILVANALNTPVLPEAHILCDLLHALKRATAEQRKTSRFYDKPGLIAFFRAILNHHLEDIADRHDCLDNLVLKDPNFSRVTQEIRKTLSDSNLIICVRDPRDIAASFISIGERELQRGLTSRYTKRDIAFICRKINESYSDLATLEDDPASLTIKYETMASNPRAALALLAERFHVEVDMRGIDWPAWLEPDARHHETWITPLEGKAPTAERIGAFHSILTDKEVRLVEDSCAPLMRRFGYTATNTFSH